MNAHTVDAGRVVAEGGHLFCRCRSARFEKCVVGDAAGQDDEFCAVDVMGEVFGVVGGRSHGIGGTNDHFNWDGDLREILGGEGDSERRGDGENGSNARIAIRAVTCSEGSGELGIGLEQIFGFADQVRKFGNIAGAVTARRVAVVDHGLRICDAACDLDHGVTAERKPGGADAGFVDARAEGAVGKHVIESGAEVVGAQPPKRESLDRVGLEGVVAWMIHRCGDVAVCREILSKPSELHRSAARPVRKQNERKPRGRCCEFGVRRGAAGQK